MLIERLAYRPFESPSSAHIHGKVKRQEFERLAVVFCIAGTTGSIARLSTSSSHRLLNRNAEPASTSFSPVAAANSAHVVAE